jgi:hypothetical protein
MSENLLDVQNFFHNKIIIIDNILSKNDCEDLINYYNIYGPTHQWTTFFPMSIDLSNEFLKFFVLKIEQSINELMKDKLSIDWCEIVRHPIGSNMNPHKDYRSDATVFTSVTYLNDSFSGGETYMSNDMKITPKTGRTLCFDGKFYRHGVTKVKENSRYTLPIWYKLNQQSNISKKSVISYGHDHKLHKFKNND